MQDEDVPFMNYRVYSCPICNKVLRLSDYDAPLVMRESHSNCLWVGTPKTFVTGGYKGVMLIWDEVLVY